MISFVIPNYNRSEFLAECIDSLQRQTYKDWEAVIVDDCSTDSSWQLLEWFAAQDSRIRVFRNEKNYGIAMTRNIGVSCASGDYIAVMDSDDICSPDRLKKELRLLEKSGVDFVYSSYVTSDAEGHPMRNGWVMPPQFLALDKVIEGYTAPHVTILAKKQLFTDHPYNNDERVNDDLRLILSWVKAGYTYKRIKEPLVIVRYHQNSVSATKDKEVKQITEKLKREYAIK